MTQKLYSEARHFCQKCGVATRPTGCCDSCGAMQFATDEYGDLANSASFDSPSVANAEDGMWSGLLDRVRSSTQGTFDEFREIGRGGMSVVYRARDIELQRYVAIKVLSPALFLAPGMVERFRDEARVYARLSHPNILAVLSVNIRGELNYLVLPYLRGPTLASILSETEVIPLDVALLILHQVGTALSYAHRNGVVHRDVKPSNIQFDGDGNAIVTDFGIARVANTSHLTSTGVIIGTPLYLSPEQCFGTDVTKLSDQYSLGVVAYQMIAGRLPFSGSPFELMVAHTSHEPTAPRELRPDCPSHVEAAILRMLAKDPANRFADIEDALGAVGAAQMSGDTAKASKHALIGLSNAYSRDDRGVALASTLTHSENRISTGERKATESSSAQTMIQSQDLGAIVDIGRHNSMGAKGGDFTQMIRPAAGEGGQQRLAIAITVLNATYDPSSIGTVVQCDRFPFSIGRESSNALALPLDLSLSRSHAQIELDDGAYVIRDLSSNGIFVNGRMLRGDTEILQLGATVVLSHSTTIRFGAHLAILPSLVGQIFGERYRAERCVYNGKQAATYCAQDLRLPRSVALKVFNPALMRLGYVRGEFNTQAELSARLQHPNICRVLDYGESKLHIGTSVESYHWLCNDYMLGGSLATRCETESELSVASVLDWIGILASALDYAHRQSVVHSDVKPSCIVFDGDGRPYLTDFALARASSGGGRPVVGTPDYLSPEQWEGRPASSASDQYSLAVVAYKLISGTLPHLNQIDPDVRQRNLRRGPPPVHEERASRGWSGVASHLSSVLAKALSPSATERYPSILEFARALREAQSARAERKASPRIFLSYRRQASAPWANYFQVRLQERYGCSVFVDTIAMDGAPRIPDRLREEIVDCDVFVCILAPSTLDSAWVREEIALAATHNKPMIPVFHEDFNPSRLGASEDANVTLLLSYQHVHLLDLRNIHIEHSIAELAERIRALV